MIILVAFAHSLSRDYARFHLAHHDPQIEVATADSLASAIHRANAMPALDVVVLDMMMPDMDGLMAIISVWHALHIPISREYKGIL